MSRVDNIDVNTAIIRQETAAREGSPFMLLRPRVFIDGNMWCALYGENLQDGVAGFGKSPEDAEADFNRAWGASLNLGE